jgi:hypothetical protein
MISTASFDSAERLTSLYLELHRHSLKSLSSGPLLITLMDTFLVHESLQGAIHVIDQIWKTPKIFLPDSFIKRLLFLIAKKPIEIEVTVKLASRIFNSLRAGRFVSGNEEFSV